MTDELPHEIFVVIDWDQIAAAFADEEHAASFARDLGGARIRRCRIRTQKPQAVKFFEAEVSLRGPYATPADVDVVYERRWIGIGGPQGVSMDDVKAPPYMEDHDGIITATGYSLDVLKSNIDSVAHRRGYKTSWSVPEMRGRRRYD